MLLIFFGHIGTGKTSIAKNVAARLGYEAICFDDIVKEIFGEKKIYGGNDNFQLSLEETQKVYDKMHKQAEDKLKVGQGVVLESMYFKKQRDGALDIAKHLSRPYKLIEIICDEDVIQKRLVQRKQQDDQTPGYTLYLKYKNLLESEPESHIIVDTTNKSIEESTQEVMANIKQI